LIFKYEIGKINLMSTINSAERRILHDPSKVSVHMVFITHRSPGDAAEVGKLIPSCQIFVPEVVGWNQQTLKKWQDISQGKRDSLVEEGVDTFRRGLYKSLYGTRKVVGFFDLPESHPLDIAYLEFDKRHKQRIDALTSTPLKLRGVDFADEFVRENTGYAYSFAPLTRAREDWMVEQFPANLDAIIARRPSLLKQDRIRVVTAIGRNHFRFYQGVRDMGYKVSRAITDLGVFSYVTELIRRVASGRPLDRQLEYRSAFENYIFSPGWEEDLIYLTGSAGRTHAVTRQLVGMLSIEEMRWGLERLTAQPGSSQDLANEIFLRRNIEFPYTPEELNKILSRVDS
jgi:hypothetical protein